MLTTRLANESARGVQWRLADRDAILDSSGPGGVPATLADAEADGLRYLARHQRARSARTRSRSISRRCRSTTRRLDLSGTTKKSEEIDLLVTELKKIECFKNNVGPGSIDTLP